jgi:hypothetical protein
LATLSNAAWGVFSAKPAKGGHPNRAVFQEKARVITRN